jgi:hypothetical protein
MNFYILFKPIDSFFCCENFYINKTPFLTWLLFTNLIFVDTTTTTGLFSICWPLSNPWFFCSSVSWLLWTLSALVVDSWSVMIDSLNTVAHVLKRAGLVNASQLTTALVTKITSWLENTAVLKVNGAATLIYRILLIKQRAKAIHLQLISLKEIKINEVDDEPLDTSCCNKWCPLIFAYTIESGCFAILR